MEHRIESIFVFGNYKLDPEGQVLLCNNEIVPLTPKLFETLRLLVENGGRTLSKETFLTSLWPDTFVEESNLAQYIFHLRRMLGENSDGQTYIKTVPRRGYQFVAPVKVVLATPVNGITYSSPDTGGDNGSGATRAGKRSVSRTWRYIAFAFPLFAILFLALYIVVWRQPQSAPASQPAPGKESIAVLRFKHIGEVGSDADLGMGMTDALITKLSNLTNIKVRPTSSIINTGQTDPMEIGRELMVDTVLDGTIQSTGDVIRVTVQLINVRDGVTIWANKFDSGAKDVFAVQDSISEQVSLSLVNRLNQTEIARLNKRHTNNLAAYEAYSRGRYFWATSSRTNFSKAVEYFEKAIELDPGYALAYSGLADAQILVASTLTGTSSAVENEKSAKANVLRALELDGSLAEPHATLAAITFQEGGDWNAVEKEFLVSIELNPNYSVAYNWYSLHLLAQGQFATAETMMRRALEIDPVSPSMTTALGQIYYFGKQYDLAIKQFEKSIELDPKFVRANVYLALSLGAIGKDEQAVQLMESVSRDYPTYTNVKTALGYLYSKSGRPGDAKKMLSRLEKIENPSVFEKYGIALINLHLGNREKSIEILKEISSFRSLNLIVRLKFDPELNILRQDKEFEDLLSKANG